MSDAPPPVHAGATAGGDGPMSAEQIDALLADFRAWLEAGGEAAPEPVGLLTLAREFTALRHEVNLQTKASRAAVEKLSMPADPREVQRPLLEALVDIADALDHAASAANTAAELTPPGLPPTRRGLFRTRAERELQAWAEQLRPFLVSAKTRLVGMANGYSLSRKRVTRALFNAGLTPIKTVGERFDPETMEAIDMADGDDVPSGTVIAESRRGYHWHGEVFRFARVTVAR